MYELTPAQVERLRDIVDQDMDARVTDDYSGRGMFGRTCIGIVGADPFSAALRVVATLAVDAATLADDDAADLVEALVETTMSRDSMGLGTIIYWPNVSVSAELDES